MRPLVFWWFCAAFLTLQVIYGPVAADYHCLCNYATTEPVRNRPDANSSVIGYLSMFECKPLASPLPQHNYFSIQFMKLLAFVLSSERISIQECAGNPSNQDLIDFAATQQSTTVSVATTVPTETSTVLTDCPNGWQTYRTACYLLHINAHQSWHTSNTLCSNHNAHLVFVNDAAEKDFIEKQLPQQVHGPVVGIWLGAMYNTSWTWEHPTLGTQGSVDTNLVPFTEGLYPGDHLEAGKTVCGGLYVHISHSYNFRDCKEGSGYVCEMSRSTTIVGR